MFSYLRSTILQYNPCKTYARMFRNRNNWVPSRMTYHGVFWAISVLSLFVTVGDRLWVSQTGGDLLLKRESRSIIPGSDRPLGDWLTNWFWLITARTLIVSLNISFVTVMWMIPNFLEEAAPAFLDMDVRHSNIQIHKFAGIWLNGFVVVIHCALLFLPTIIDGTPLHFMWDGFDFSNWWDPCVRTFSAYITPEDIYFTYDEVFRLILSVLCFCILIPISRADWMLGKSYSFAMGIHAFAGFAFMYDMVRKNSHPLCYRFNLPFIFLYIIDRIFSTFFYRVNRFKVHKIQRCSDTCFVLFGHLDNLPYRGQGCGDNYWLLHRFQRTRPCSPIFQRAHPYTSFQNWDEKSRDLWNIGFVIRTNPKNAHSWSLWLMEQGLYQHLGNNSGMSERNLENRSLEPTLKPTAISEGIQNPAYRIDEETKETHQQTLGDCSTTAESSADCESEGEKPSFESNKRGLRKQMSLKIVGANFVSEDSCFGLQLDLRSYGPYRSSFYVIGNSYTQFEHLVLIAGGSGFGYFLSALTMINDYERENMSHAEEKQSSKLTRTTIIYTARENQLISLCGQMLSSLKNFDKCNYRPHYTGKDCEHPGELKKRGKSYQITSEPSQCHYQGYAELPSSLQITQGRLDIDHVLSEFKDVRSDTLVCACASTGFLDQIKLACYKYALRLRVEEI